MTESMEVKDKNYRKWSGLSVVSGMAVLDTVVDSVAEEENALAVSTKDDSFYIIRKRGGEWYYSDTPVKVNVDQAGELASKYNVFSIPTLILLYKGEIIAQQVGAGSKETYQNMIDRALEKI